ncbi:MAG: RIP metalloprotease RseP, partial [Desulfobulbaceae bacterium]|nr:RIP metalloprotease RseP [Desulfobulbaceae bacterium]
NETVSAEMAGRSFAAKSVWKRFMVVLAGPISNLISAIVIFTVVILITGIPHPLPTTEIGEISPGSAAEQAGLKPGDIVVAIDGKAITSWSEVSESVKKSGGKELTVSIKRGAELIDATGAPTTSEVKNIFGEVVDTRFLLGISQKQSLRYEPATLSGAFIEGVEQTWFYIELTVLSLWKIIQRVIPASQIGGPIMIAQMAGQQMEAGWISLFSFMAVLSVNLGIINLFPIPILDGGHLVFFSIEALRRKPLTLRAQEILQQVGMFLLGSLMLFVFYNDFARLFGKG